MGSSPDFIKRPAPGFSFTACARGFQLALLGAYRALHNPQLSKNKYYTQAKMALKISLIIQLSLWLPLYLMKWTIVFIQFLVSVTKEEGEEADVKRGASSFLEILSFIQSILNVGSFLISSIRYFRPELDEMFLTSLDFVDSVYISKHPKSKRKYHPNLVRNRNTKCNNTPGLGLISKLMKSLGVKQKNSKGFSKFLANYVKRTGLSLAIFAISRIPYIGRFVLAGISFYNFNGVVGTTAAVTVFAISLMFPPKFIVIFISSFWGGRSLMRDLLQPYFSRVPFNSEQRSQWIKAREGILYGFSFCFYFLMKIPFVGVLMYGFAEASSAYLISKVTEPIPETGPLIENWIEEEVLWTNKAPEFVETTENTTAMAGQSSVSSGAYDNTSSSAIPGSFGIFDNNVDIRKKDLIIQPTQK